MNQEREGAGGRQAGAAFVTVLLGDSTPCHEDWWGGQTGGQETQTRWSWEGRLGWGHAVCP